MVKILVVEDDRSLSDALVYNLRREEYTPMVATDASSAVDMARREAPDLILLDLMLPGGSGLDVCRRVRDFSPVPIIMLTARSDEVDRVLGLEIGADDYVAKPFSLRELLARVKANLRRVELDRQEGHTDILESGPLRVDLRTRHVIAGEREIALQPKEFDLLAYLVQHPGRVLTRGQLLHAVWRHDFVGERTVDVHVRRVRSKLEAVGLAGIIRTVHGVGYALNAQNHALAAESSSR
jgi:two-component system alkaline phosphatase synthesis response regulator PhoP